MKPRKWVLIVALIFLALISVYQYGLHRLSKNRNLENLLVEQVGAVIGGDFDVENVKVGFFSTTLSGLKVSIPFGQTAIEVDKIRIGFSFAQYLISGGDITSSLSSIVLVDPVINIKIPEKEYGSATAQKKNEKVNSFYDMPIKSILLRNGTVHLISRWKQRVVSVDKLNGKLLEVEDGIEFDLKGRLASTGKNLTFNGSLIKEDGTLRLSTRLSKARITKKITFRDLSIYRGTLDGVVEFVFSNESFPNNISANGHVTISSGKGSLNGFNDRLNNLNMSLFFEENTLTIGKLSCDLLGVDISLTGKTGYSLLQESTFDLGIKNINSKRLLKKFKVDFDDLSGIGQANISIRKPKNQTAFKTKGVLKGLKYKNDIIKNVNLKADISSGDFILTDGNIEVDSLSINLKGTVNYMKKPFVYRLSTYITGPNNFITDELGGSFICDGEFKGIGADFKSNASLILKNLTYDSLNLGDSKLNIDFNGKRVDATTINDEDSSFYLSGYIDSLNTKKAIVHASLKVQKEPIVTVLKKHIPNIATTLNDVEFEANINGKLDEPELTSKLKIDGEKFRGDFDLRAKKNKNRWNWQIMSDSLSISDNIVPMSGSGVLQENNFSISNMVLMDHIIASGDISFDSTQAIDIVMNWDSLSLTKIDKIFLDGDSLISSGILKGNVRLSKSLKNPKIVASFGLNNGEIIGMDSISTNFVLSKTGDQITILPFLLRKGTHIVATIDTLKFGDSLSLKGEFNSIDIKHFVKDAKIENVEIDGFVTGSFSNTNNSYPIDLSLKSDSIHVSNWTFSEIKSDAKIYPDKIEVTNISAKDDKNVNFHISSLIPTRFLSNQETEKDTLFVKAEIEGDLLNTYGSHIENPVGGSGKGDCKIEFFVTDDETYFSQAYMKIDSGYMTVYPFVPDTVKNIKLFVNVDDESRLSLDFRGTVNKKPVNIYTSHNVAEGLEQFKFGLLNAGVIEVTTSEKGIPLFLPGFLEKKNLADIEFRPKDSLNAFTLSGPIEKFKLSGTWVIRNAEFTFPFVDEEPPPEDDPFPYVTWDLDLRVGNRNVTYFYNVGGKKRRVMRFVECSLDPPTTKLGVRGRDKDGTFRLIGNIRSYRGNVFYGKIFERNFELGCDFVPVKNRDAHGYNNLPIIWGSVEAFSDTSRFDRITLKLLTKDPDNGTMNEKGRFNEITFRLSSNFEEVPGESERAFFREAGLNIVTLKGAGSYVSDFGDSYVNQYLLGRIERKIARKIGLDVISVETSVASNYFNYLADSSFGGFSDQLYYLTFANVGVTIGRYFLRDRIFVKWRTELMPIDLSLVPEHSIGFEYQPVKYLWFDFNYGFHKENGEIQYDPKVMMQLRMPLDRIKKAFNGNK